MEAFWSRKSSIRDAQRAIWKLSLAQSCTLQRKDLCTLSFTISRDAKKCKKNDVLCRACFSQRFSLGTCELCKGPVLGEREEGGPHVTGRGGAAWHAKCFICYSK